MVFSVYYPDMHPSPTASSTLTQAASWWLDVRCACGWRDYLSCRMLARVCQPDRTVAQVVRRLRCQDCAECPAMVALIDYPLLGASSYAVGDAKQRRVQVGAATWPPQVDDAL